MKHLSYNDLIFKDEWVYSNPDHGFFYQSGVIPGEVFYSYIAGDIYQEDAEKAAESIRKFFKEGYLKGSKYYRIADYTNVRNAPVKTRQIYTDVLNEMNKTYESIPVVTYICGAGVWIKIALLFAQKLVKQNYVFVDSVEKAFELINSNYGNNEIPEGSLINNNAMNPPEDTNETVEVPKKEIKAIANYIGSSIWDENGNIAELEIKPDNPLSIIYEAVRGINLDIRELLESEYNKEIEISKSEAKYRTLFENAPDAIYITDLQGNFIDGNSKAEELTGYRREEIRSQPLIQSGIISKASIPKAIRVHKKNTEGLSTGPDEFRIKKKDGNHFTAEISTFPIEIEGEKLILGIARDITERREREKKIRENEIFMKGLFNAIQDGISILNPDLTIRYTNPAMEKFFKTKESLQGKKCYSMYNHDKKKCTHCPAIKAKKSGKVEHEIVADDIKDPKEWHEIFAYPLKDTSDNEVTGIIEFVRDVTEQKKSAEELEKMAYTDILTGSYNRYALDNLLNDRINAYMRYSHFRALILIDIDKFKNINDKYGHRAGDKVLKQFADKIRSVIRNDDYTFRIGGDEFIVYLNEVRKEMDAGIVAEKLLEAFSEPFPVNKHKNIKIKSSLGIAMFPKDGQNVNMLWSNADKALFYAKKESQKKYLFYNKEIEKEHKRIMHINELIEESISQNYLELFFQPLYKNGTLERFESLLRIRHPHEGIIVPAAFISAAEHGKTISTLDNFALKTSCDQIAEWEKEGYEYGISVNVSTISFDQRYCDLTEYYINTTGIDPSLLCIEITESTYAEAYEETIALLHRLKKIGVSMSIDDFGTGYSSFSRLADMPVNELKIDKSFIDDIDRDTHKGIKNKRITRSMIELGHSLDLSVVAEGVETGTQLDILTKMHADVIQGFYYSKPLPADEIKRAYLPVHTT
ncbi:MAG: EAL and GGDEF domain-containing protein [Chitinivibrionales bacterium]